LTEAHGLVKDSDEEKKQWRNREEEYQRSATGAWNSVHDSVNHDKGKRKRALSGDEELRCAVWYPGEYDAEAT